VRGKIAFIPKWGEIVIIILPPKKPLRRVSWLSNTDERKHSEGKGRPKGGPLKQWVSPPCVQMALSRAGTVFWRRKWVGGRAREAMFTPAKQGEICT
jgi:hypothetical protein